MVAVKISDGLGNQMFQFACAYAQSRRLNTDIVLDATLLDCTDFREYALDKFPIESRVIRFKFLKIKSLMKAMRLLKDMIHFIIYKKYAETTNQIFEERILNTADRTKYVGYFQTEKYFKAYREELLEIFQYRNYSDGAAKWLHQIENDDSSVSIHIRRGDYVALGFCLSAQYYIDSINYITERVENPLFYVFSDDHAYSKVFMDELGVNYSVVSYDSVQTTIEDMMLMSKCRHNIIAYSSYSWWGAWLNRNQKKIVICPDTHTEREFFPETWIKQDPT